MQLPDLNLLPALDALLREESVTAAARALSVSPPAMSRTLGRLRRVVGDPLLVPAGRGMAATPAARALREPVREALDAALGLLSPAGPADPARLRRVFTIRTSDVVTCLLAPVLAATAARAAPGVTLRFAGEGDEDPAALREGVDLDIGVLGPQPREIRHELLGLEPLVPVVRAGHPLAGGGADLAAFAAAPHVAVSRRGRAHGPVDDLLAGAGLRRRVVLTVPSHVVAAHAVRAGDLVALLPRSFTPIMGEGLVPVPVPGLELPPMRIECAWHRRHDVDGGHAWLRGLVRECLADR